MDESFWRCCISGGEDSGSVSAASFGESEVHIVRRVQAEARMPVLGVVPAKEICAMSSSIFE